MDKQTYQANIKKAENRSWPEATGKKKRPAFSGTNLTEPKKKRKKKNRK